MFGEQFYPTPKALIRQMIEPYYISYNHYDFEDKSILEPSAGKGDIANFIKELRNRTTSIDCVELDPNLQHVLRGNGHRVVGTDFLEFVPTCKYHLILMNPPFANGDEHLLHAWDIAGNTDIVCILNAQTLKNPHTKRRQLLASIIAEHGSVKYQTDTFIHAERATAVEVAIVRLTKKVAANEDPFFINMETEENFTNFTEESMETGLSIPDAIQDHVRMYQRSQAELIVLVKSIAKLEMLASPILNRSCSVTNMIKEHIGTNPQKMYNEMSNAISASAWDSIFAKTNLRKYMTSKVRDNFATFIQEQGRLAFTENNIKEMFEMLFNNRVNILEQALLDVFDLMTNFHKDNRMHVEGWKTNDAFKVNRKVILPYVIEFDDKYTSDKSGQFSKNYRRGQVFDDIDKALCLITGDQYDAVKLADGTVINGIDTSEEALTKAFKKLGYIRPGDKFDNTCSSHFFNFKFWKKGTLHMEFKDPWLWEQFNIMVARKRMWLPNDYTNKYKPTAKYPALANVL